MSQYQLALIDTASVHIVKDISQYIQNKLPHMRYNMPICYRDHVSYQVYLLEVFLYFCALHICRMAEIPTRYTPHHTYVLVLYLLLYSVHVLYEYVYKDTVAVATTSDS